MLGPEIGPRSSSPASVETIAERICHPVMYPEWVLQFYTDLHVHSDSHLHDVSLGLCGCVIR